MKRVVLFFQTKVTVKYAIEGFELIAKIPQPPCVLVDVYLHSRFVFVPDCFPQIESVGVKNHKIISTYEHCILSHFDDFPSCFTQELDSFHHAAG